MASIPILQMFLTYMLLHSYDQKNKKRASKAGSRAIQRRSIRNVHKFLSVMNSAQTQMLVIGKTAKSYPRIFQKHMRGFLRDEVERDGIFVDLELSQKCARAEPVMNSRSYTAKQSNTTNTGNHDTGVKNNTVVKYTLKDEQATGLHSEREKQAPFKAKASSEWVRKKRTPADFFDKKPEVQSTPVWAYLQSCMIPEDHCAGVLSTAIDVKFFSAYSAVY